MCCIVCCSVLHHVDDRQIILMICRVNWCRGMAWAGANVLQGVLQCVLQCVMQCVLQCVDDIHRISRMCRRVYCCPGMAW